MISLETLLGMLNALREGLLKLKASYDDKLASHEARVRGLEARVEALERKCAK
jgi:hypothetical protein